ncbi:MAG: anaerobic ribonucleoside-triphosphate reductase [Elusimicrobia bacterium]|nr:anaerobic ribonucleoside-triphosphate reductase [Elusimicrobiota bacterium]
MKTNFNVLKKDGEIVRFSPEKIYRSLSKSAREAGMDRKNLSQIYRQIISIAGETFLPNETVKSDTLERMLLNVLQEKGYSNLARLYYSHSKLKKSGRKIKVVKKKDVDVTDYSLLVTNTSGIVTSPWQRDRITKALVKETGLNRETAREIAKEVEREILRSRLKEVSTSLIRTLIDASLLKRGYNKIISRQTEVGISTYDLEKIVLSKPKENSNIASHNPEAVNLAIAEVALKQYALNRVFSSSISSAHREGIIHIHDLGYPTRVYCSAHSPEYLKKYGLKLDNLDIISRPAKYARTLTGHLNTFLASMQAFYAGALGISYVNIFYAPFLKGMSYSEIKQEAQYLIFSLSQSAFSRGGQVLFVDANVHTGIPSYLRDVPVIGPGGKYTGEKYGQYKKEAQLFLRALLEVWKEGDARGHVFAFPKCDLHINEESFSDPDERKLLEFACEVASSNGSPYFIFDRDEVTLSACCRLRTKIDDREVINHPERLRFCGFQNVTINLPQAAYRCARKNKKTLEGILDEIERAMEIAVKAHLEKRKFIKKMMEPGMPLYPVGKKAADGHPYVDLDRATYIIGVIGLNECLEFLTGFQMHANDEIYEMGLKIISFMYLKAKDYEKKYGLKFSLEESPAESAARRLAKVDLALFPEAKDVVKGSIDRDEAYYTNSIHFVPDARMGLIDRIEKQARFHPLIESGAITHAFVGEKKPPAKAIFKLVEKCWRNTQTAQITISPEFTACEDCGRQTRGIKQNCSYCGSVNVYGITRIVGYFSRIPNWNKSKIGELKDRRKGDYAL